MICFNKICFEHIGLVFCNSLTECYRAEYVLFRHFLLPGEYASVHESTNRLGRRAPNRWRQWALTVRHKTRPILCRTAILAKWCGELLKEIEAAPGARTDLEPRGDASPMLTRS